MESEIRISADQARRQIESGRALLVCAYDDEEKCRKLMFEGALTLKQLEERLESLPEGVDILFYCA
jgi:hypothetical protein